MPPQGWAPPFSVDIEKFQFTPRVQKLNELEVRIYGKKGVCRIQFQKPQYWELSIILPIDPIENISAT